MRGMGYKGDKMKETIQSIINWHAETFPDATLGGQIIKYREELSEYLAAVKSQNMEDMYSEWADLLIVCCGIARFEIMAAPIYIMRTMDFIIVNNLDVGDCIEAINKKMEINRKRDWNFNNGQYKHKQ